jgi:hypothetical protein
MKKNLIINLLDGKKMERDITNAPGFPIGAPANHESYAVLCQTISANGYTDVNCVTEKHYRHIAPSQIVSVEVKFEN